VAFDRLPESLTSIVASLYLADGRSLHIRLAVGTLLSVIGVVVVDKLS